MNSSLVKHVAICLTLKSSPEISHATETLSQTHRHIYHRTLNKQKNQSLGINQIELLFWDLKSGVQKQATNVNEWGAEGKSFLSNHVRD